MFGGRCDALAERYAVGCDLAFVPRTTRRTNVVPIGRRNDITEIDTAQTLDHTELARDGGGARSTCRISPLSYGRMPMLDGAPTIAIGRFISFPQRVALYATAPAPNHSIDKRRDKKVCHRTVVSSASRTRLPRAEAPQVTFGVSRPVDARPVGCISWRLHDRRARSASPIVVRVNVWHDEVCGVPVFAP